MENISTLQLKLLSEIEKNPTGSQIEIGKAAGIQGRALINYHLKELILKGRLKKIPAKWKVI